ncbi:MAG: rhodanese-like domain-containing protein [Salaquimonas sp.]
MFFRSFLAAAMLVFSLQISFAAEIMSAPEALEKAQAGELVLIDIRRPSEWKESGVASVATLLSMHEAGFLEGLEKIKSDNPGKQIALICATGGRSSYLQKELTKRGLGDTIDVSEGMFGNGNAPGWLKRNLSLRKIQ